MGETGEEEAIMVEETETIDGVTDKATIEGMVVDGAAGHGDIADFGARHYTDTFGHTTISIGLITIIIIDNLAIITITVSIIIHLLTLLL